MNLIPEFLRREQTPPLINGDLQQFHELEEPMEMDAPPPPVMGKLVVDTPGARRVTREELALIPIPESTATFKPIPHHQLIEIIEETLAYRRINIAAEEFAVAKRGMQMFACIELTIEDEGVRFALGIRTANDRSLRLSMVAGYRVFICTNLAFSGQFQPLLHKHTKNLDLQDSLAVALDRTQRHFDKLPRQIRVWKEQEVSELYAKETLYDAFVGGGLKIPIRFLKEADKHYFNDERFPKGNFWSLSNAGTSTFKLLDADKQFAATAQWGAFLQKRFDQLPPF